MYVDADFFFGSSLADRYLLGAIQDLFRVLAPSWSLGLGISDPKEGAPPIAISNPSALYDAVMFDITTKSPFYHQLEEQLGTTTDERLCGFVELHGVDSSIAVFVDLDENRFCRFPDKWIWGNCIAFQFRRRRVESVAVDRFTWRLFHKFCSDLQPWYAPRMTQRSSRRRTS